MKRRGGRPQEPYIADPATHPRQSVNLTVAADYLGIDERTLRRRIDAKEIPAMKDGKIYRIALADLLAYDSSHLAS